MKGKWTSIGCALSLGVCSVVSLHAQQTPPPPPSPGEDLPENAEPLAPAQPEPAPPANTPEIILQTQSIDTKAKEIDAKALKPKVFRCGDPQEILYSLDRHEDGALIRLVMTEKTTEGDGAPPTMRYYFEGGVIFLLQADSSYYQSPEKEGEKGKRIFQLVRHYFKDGAHLASYHTQFAVPDGENESAVRTASAFQALTITSEESDALIGRGKELLKVDSDSSLDTALFGGQATE